MRIPRIVTFLALAGCASGGPGGSLMNGIMESWSGSKVDEVIRQWGYPSEERTVAGRKLYVWRRDEQLTMPATSTTTGTVNRIGSTAYYQGTTSTYGGGTSQWTCIRMLEVDGDERVVGYQWQGNNCPFLEAGPYANWRKK